MTTRGVMLAVSAVLLLMLAGCGARAAGPSAGHGDLESGTRPRQRPSTMVDLSAATPSGRVATRFALATRSWTPVNYRSRYREQLRLSTGSLRSALRRGAPTRRQLAAYRADRAHSEATVVAAKRLVKTSSLARYELVLDERIVASGQTVEASSTYAVELQGRHGRWRVAAFSVLP